MISIFLYFICSFDYTFIKGLVDLVEELDPSQIHVQVSQYLRSKKWDTRVAAAHAVGAIAENVKHTSLTELSGCVEAKLLEAGISATFDDVVTWSSSHSKIGAGTSFRRSFSLCCL